MDVLSNLALGFSVALEPINLVYAFLGVLLGTAIGVLPGLGPVATISILLPVTFTLQPQSAIIMLAGIYYGAAYGGSTTAILVNLPGESSSVVTTLDGYQMARKGKAGLALATAALSSFMAGTIATFIIAFAAPALAEFALDFGPADYFSLMVFGLVAAVILAHGSVIKAIGMILVGILLGTMGIDVNSSLPRYTFGVPQFGDGIDFAVIAMGIFGIGETITNLGRGAEAREYVKDYKGLWPKPHDLKEIVRPALRGTFLGAALGILPGGGPVLASFSAYALEKRISDEPEKFGKGAIEGVAAPEAANNSASQTAFIPLLTLGLPASPVMALMVGALMMHGLYAGPQLIAEKPELFWGLVASMWIGNLLLVVLNLPLVGFWAKLLTVPYRLLYPSILLICCIGVYSIRNDALDVIVASVFGLVGYVLTRLQCEPAPLLLGFILGPLIEENLRRALLISHGSPAVFVERPISLVFLILTAIVVLILLLPAIRAGREKVFAEDAG
ncbi:tripartite tricarboxylate transporter permease [Rhodoplanes sp. TEM]|uniref:Tripartite tricarboxylate transporter permease n=1 Tax=Rhodoplanes tepidamans TaxID=200616 RepID=A0ABT5JB36_RHOTP|nr:MULTISPECIES: tripartite tricarboxylate transporter permease [Rhodoplanes]MDC7786879.1 tripartite tricarboxylate transporter permease [Rhodoplanes tepidamans]MDC7984192.1 tripartite tricarboxylate transporter permease [Rhodoplanes sp. TEM]MDQ0356007.1 TctA family transporter [Rhodoplanes tepidamans]